VRLTTYTMLSGVGQDNKYDLQRIARAVGAAAQHFVYEGVHACIFICVCRQENGRDRDRKRVNISELSARVAVYVYAYDVDRIFAHTHTEVASKTAERAAPEWSHTHADNRPQVISAAVNLPHVHYMPSITAAFASELSLSSDEVHTHTPRYANSRRRAHS